MTATTRPAPWPLEGHTVHVNGRELCTTTRPEVAARLAARINGTEPDPVVTDDGPAGYLPDGTPVDMTADALEALARIVDDLATERIASLSEPREVVVVGWDGASRPMYRYRDEMDRPDHARSIVRPEDRPTA